MTHEEKAKIIINMDQSQASQQIAKLETQIKKLHQEMIAASKADVVDERKIRRISKQIASLEKQQERLRKSAFHYSQVLKNLSGASLNDLNRAYKQLSWEVKNLDRNTEEYARKVKQLALLQGEIGRVRQEMRGVNAAAKQGNGIWGSLGGTITKFAGWVGGALVAVSGLTRAVGRATEKIQEFEEGLTNVFTLLSPEEMEKYGKYLEQGAIDLIQKYGFSIEDVNQSLFDTVSAGVNAGKSIEFLNEASKLATAGVTDLGTAVDGMTSVMNAWQLSADQADKVAAAFFSAQKYGKTTVAELSAEIGKIAPIANQAGISYQEVLAALSELTKQGLSTAESTTALKSAISSLINPSEEARKTLSALGVPLGKQQVEAAGLTGSLEALNRAFQTNPDAVSKAIGNIEALTAISALSGDALQDYQQILEQVNTDYGEGSSIAQAYAKQQNTIAFQTRRLKGEATALALSFRDELKPVLMALFKAATSIMTAIRGLIDRFRAFRKESTVWATLKETISSVWQTIAGFIIELFKLWKTLFQVENKGKLLQLRLQYIALAIRVMLIPMKVLLSVLTYLVREFREFLETNKTVQAVSQAIGKAIDWIREKLEQLANLPILKKIFEPVIQQSNELGKKVGQSLGKIIEKTKEVKNATDETGKSLKKLSGIYDQMLDEYAKHIGVTKKELLHLFAESTQALEAYKEWVTKKLREIAEERKKADATLLQEIQKYHLQLITDEEEKAREELAIWYEKEKKKIETSKASTKVKQEALAALEELYQQKLDGIETKYYEKRREKLKELNSFIVSEMEKLARERGKDAEQEVERIRKMYDQKIAEALQYAEKYAQTDPELSEQYRKKAETLAKLRDDAIAAYRKKKEEETQKEILSIREKYGLITNEEMMQKELSELEAAYQHGLLSYEEYMQAKKKIEEKYKLSQKKAQQERMKQELSMYSEVLNGMESMLSAWKEAELKQYEGNEKKKKEIMKKYAAIELAVDISKIIAATALGIANIWKEYADMPIIAGILTALLVGQATAQAAIVAQQKAKIMGMASGGLVQVERAQDGRSFMAGYEPGRRGLVSRPTILVGEEGPEYVIPSEGLRNPDIARLVSVMETYRKSNALKYFSMKALGLAEGGMIGQLSLQSSLETGRIVEKLDEVNRNLARYTEKVDTWQRNLKVSYQSWKDMDDKYKTIHFGRTSESLI